MKRIKINKKRQKSIVWCKRYHFYVFNGYDQAI